MARIAKQAPALKSSTPHRSSPTIGLPAHSSKIGRHMLPVGKTMGEPKERKRVQAKVKIGDQNDPAEREADRVAKHVMEQKDQRDSEILPTGKKILRKANTQNLNEKITDESPIKIRKMDSPRSNLSGATEPNDRIHSTLNKLGAGSPLPMSEKRFFEPRFNQDFSNIRIHNDAASNDAANAINARAFAMGNQIAFARGEYSPGTQAGRTLMAHELTHTIQQSGATGVAQGKFVQRAEKKTKAKVNGTKNLVSGEGTEANPFTLKDIPGVSLVAPENGNAKLVISEFTIPEKEGSATKENPYGKGAHNSITSDKFIYQGHLASKSASSVWKSKSDSEIKSETIKNYIKGQRTPENTIGENQDTVVFKLSGAEEYFIGTPETLSENALLRKPNWDETGNVQDSFDVDHIHERQLGGSHEWENFWMIPKKPNIKFGQESRKEIRQKILKPIEAFNQDERIKGKANVPTKDDFSKPGIKEWSIEFKSLIKNKSTEVKDEESWTRDEIVGLKHLQHLKVVSRKDAEALGFGSDKLILMTHSWGGYRYELERKSGKTVSNKVLFNGFYMENVNIDNGGQIAGEIFREQTKKYAKIENKKLVIKLVERDDRLFHYINLPDLREKLKQIPLSLNSASPVQFHDGGVSPTGALFAHGQVTATKLIFPGLQFPVQFYGDSIFVDAPITSEALKFGIVNITHTNLRIGFGEPGVILGGHAGISVSGVGHGELVAGMTGTEVTIKGDFNFDHDFFDPLALTAEYNYTKDTFTIGGNLKVKSGVLPGVETGNISVSISRDAIDISGSLKMGGVLSGTTLTVSYAPDTGITIGGENIPLTPLAKIPGVSSASASIMVNYQPEKEAWNVSGSGDVAMDIAGTSGNVSVAVDGEYVDLSGSLQVSKGPATGSLNFNATNAPVIEPPAQKAQEQVNQAPQDYSGLSAFADAVLSPPPSLKERGPVQNEMSVWGDGSASIAFGDVLTGQAGLVLSKTGGVVISGGISLPPRLSIFDEKTFEKNLLDVNLSFPIWGVNIIGYKLGVFANLGTTVNFSTFIGPAEIVGANVTAIMDLDNPSAATLKGKGRLQIPAGASLRLDLYGGVSAEIPFAGALGKVGIYGELVANALVANDLEIDWSLGRGLEIATNAEISANAALNFGIFGSVDVWAPFYSDTFGPWDKEIGSIGGALNFDANFPFNWDEKNGLNFDISKIDVAEPEIDSKKLSKDAFNKVV